MMATTRLSSAGKKYEVGNASMNRTQVLVSLISPKTSENAVPPTDDPKRMVASPTATSVASPTVVRSPTIVATTPPRVAQPSDYAKQAIKLAEKYALKKDYENAIGQCAAAIGEIKNNEKLVPECDQYRRILSTNQFRFACKMQKEGKYPVAAKLVLEAMYSRLETNTLTDDDLAKYSNYITGMQSQVLTTPNQPGDHLIAFLDAVDREKYLFLMFFSLEQQLMSNRNDLRLLALLCNQFIYFFRLLNEEYAYQMCCLVYCFLEDTRQLGVLKDVTFISTTMNNHLVFLQEQKTEYALSWHELYMWKIFKFLINSRHLELISELTKNVTNFPDVLLPIVVAYAHPSMVTGDIERVQDKIRVGDLAKDIERVAHARGTSSWCCLFVDHPELKELATDCRGENKITVIEKLKKWEKTHKEDRKLVEGWIQQLSPSFSFQ